MGIVVRVAIRDALLPEAASRPVSRTPLNFKARISEKSENARLSYSIVTISNLRAISHLGFDQ